MVDERRNQPDFGPPTDDIRRDFDEATYRYISLIGSGGMGDVIEAEDVRLRTRVAIKRLKNVAIDPVDQVRAQDRMRLEGEVQAKLVHPALLRVFAAGVTRSGCPFLVSERLIGRSLGAELKARTFLPVPEALSIACAALGGLEYAHSANIVHRDVKPDNIFLTDAPPGGSRGVKVVDFGLAKLLGTALPTGDAREAVTADGTILGTAPYMSPEQAAGRPVDARSDLFSLGTILYEMLAGRRPFDADSCAGTLAAILRDAPLPIPGVAPQVGRIVERCLCKDVSRRFQSAVEVKAAIEACAVRSSVRESPSIAVLPFLNMTGSKEDDYLCEGLAEEIINALIRIPGLKVIARTSVFAVSRMGLDVREVGARLDVGHILEGSVRREGRRVRVTA